MMPHSLGIVYPLPRLGQKCVQSLRYKLSTRRHHDQIRLRRKGNESLAAEWMSFHHPQLKRELTWLTTKQTHHRFPMTVRDVNPGEIVIPFGRTVVDRKMICALRRYHIAELR